MRWNFSSRGSTKAVKARNGQLLEQRAAVGDRAVRNRREPFELPSLVGGEQGLEQGVLAREVIVEGALADAYGGGHVPQAGPEVALLGEEVEGGVEDGLTGALSVGVLGAGHNKLMVVHLFRSVKP